MFISAVIKADEVHVFKLVKTKAKASLVQQNQKNKNQQGSKLDVEGLSETGDVIFLFSNTQKQLSQSFGINIKKYFSHQEINNHPSRMFVNKANYTDEEKLIHEQSEGAYTFRPEWYDQLPHQYGTLSDDITYQSGQNIEQWSIFYKNCTSQENAIIKIRFSPLF